MAAGNAQPRLTAIAAAAQRAEVRAGLVRMGDIDIKLQGMKRERQQQDG